MRSFAGRLWSSILCASSLRDRIDPRFAGPDYGLPDEATIIAIRKAASLEAMLNDPVHEGKSMVGLIATARDGESPRDRRFFMCISAGRQP
jgi:1-aminocyclopropane-1-carboxylate deaminase/D-cysteine desulfhydrase-like pyridoxal-dependent ACC family enzyme